MIIFLYGQDTFRSRQKLKELKNKFLNEIDPSGNSLSVLDGRNVNLKEIGETIGPSSLLAKKRMIIIEELFLNKNCNLLGQMYEYLKNKKQTKDENIIIFWDSSLKSKRIKNKLELFIIDVNNREKLLVRQPLELFKFLLKQKYSSQFNLLNTTEVAVWIKKEVVKRGCKISNQASQILASLIGNDLWQINNEVEKLINFKLATLPKITKDYNSVNIEVDDVEKLVRGNFDENIFALTDAIGNKNKPLAIKLLEEQITAGLTDSHLLTMLIRQFKILMQTKQALSTGYSNRKIVNFLKLHPFIVQKAISQANNFSLNALKDILNHLLKIDHLMKIGKIETRTMLNLLIAKI